MTDGQVPEQSLEHRLDDLAYAVVVRVVCPTLVLCALLLMGGAHRLLVAGHYLYGIVVAGSGVGLGLLALMLAPAKRR